MTWRAMVALTCDRVSFQACSDMSSSSLRELLERRLTREEQSTKEITKDVSGMLPATPRGGPD